MVAFPFYVGIMYQVQVMYFVYIIESLSSGKWYYGFTNQPCQRLEAHNKGMNKSTAGRGPWKYIFQRSFESKSDAHAFELYLKRPEIKFISVLSFQELLKKQIRGFSILVK